jgi:hypothetical protein
VDHPPELAARRRRQSWIAGGVTLGLIIIVCGATATLTHSLLAAFLALCGLCVLGFPVLIVVGIVQARREADGRRIPDQPLEPSPRLIHVATRTAQVLLGLTLFTGVIQLVAALVFHTH